MRSFKFILLLIAFLLFRGIFMTSQMTLSSASKETFGRMIKKLHKINFVDTILTLFWNNCNVLLKFMILEFITVFLIFTPQEMMKYTAQWIICDRRFIFLNIVLIYFICLICNTILIDYLLFVFYFVSFNSYN